MTDKERLDLLVLESKEDLGKLVKVLTEIQVEVKPGCDILKLVSDLSDVEAVLNGVRDRFLANWYLWEKP